MNGSTIERMYVSYLSLEREDFIEPMYALYLATSFFPCSDLHQDTRELLSTTTLFSCWPACGVIQCQFSAASQSFFELEASGQHKKCAI